MFKNLLKKHNENRRLSFRRNIALAYIVMIALGTILLFLPITNKDGNNVSFIDAFFIAASAFSDTGLSPVTTADTFNTFGQIILLILIQVGGIGIMSVKVMLFIIVGKKLNTSDRMLIFTEQNQTATGGMVKLIKESIMVVISIQLIFSVIMAIHMMINYHYQIFDAIWFGFFMSTSAINNAGFDITGNSLISFNTDYLMQLYVITLIVVGGIGFPVIVDLKNAISSYKKNKYFRFSLFTKISLVTYFSVALIGFLLVLISDYNFIFNQNSGLKGIFYAIFQVISSRNAGFSTLSITEFSQPTQLILSALMFIGAAPASTGGGIRTTTLAVIFLFLKSYSNNREDVVAFNRRIPKQTIVNAFITFVVAIMVVCVAIILISFFDSSTDLYPIVLEVTSAFGTTGLSMDYTSQLSFASKIVITFVMIIGQIGIANSMILFSRNKERDDNIKVPTEDITIG